MSLSPLAGLLSRKRLLIFDFDGTIVDSSHLHARAFNEVFSELGVSVDYSSVAGLTTEAAIDKIASTSGLRITESRRRAMIAEKRARAQALADSELVAIDGSLSFIARARQRFSLALCTSASQMAISTALDRLGLSESFDTVITAKDVRRGKPHPEGLLKVLSIHRMPAAAALVFEDAASGLQASAAAGIDAICVTRLTVQGARVYASWADLSAALDEVVR